LDYIHVQYAKSVYVINTYTNVRMNILQMFVSEKSLRNLINWLISTNWFAHDRAVAGTRMFQNTKGASVHFECREYICMQIDWFLCVTGITRNPVNWFLINCQALNTWISVSRELYWRKVQIYFTYKIKNYCTALNVYKINKLNVCRIKRL